jgi:hypothetical protein
LMWVHYCLTRWARRSCSNRAGSLIAGEIVVRFTPSSPARCPNRTCQSASRRPWPATPVGPGTAVLR